MRFLPDKRDDCGVLSFLLIKDCTPEISPSFSMPYISVLYYPRRCNNHQTRRRPGHPCHDLECDDELLSRGM